MAVYEWYPVSTAMVIGQPVRIDDGLFAVPARTAEETYGVVLRNKDDGVVVLTCEVYPDMMEHV